MDNPLKQINTVNQINTVADGKTLSVHNIGRDRVVIVERGVFPYGSLSDTVIATLNRPQLTALISQLQSARAEMDR